MNYIKHALNHPDKAYHDRLLPVSLTFVLITILINAIAKPLHMMKLIGFGLLSYALLCFFFFVVGILLGSKLSYKDHLYSWGISFAPNILCAIIVPFTEYFFYVFWNNSIWGMLLNIVFIGILLWKLILYVIYLHEYMGLNKWRLAIAFVVIGIIIGFMAPLNGYVGIMTPVL